jgi:hypothetical protein
VGSAENFLKSWATAALKSRIPSLRKFVGTLREHWENILAFIKRPLTNAVGEGLNRIIKIVKNRACRISQSGELHRPDLPHRRRPRYPCANPESASHRDLLAEGNRGKLVLHRLMEWLADTVGLRAPRGGLLRWLFERSLFSMAQ